MKNLQNKKIIHKLLQVFINQIIIFSIFINYFIKLFSFNIYLK